MLRLQCATELEARAKMEFAGESLMTDAKGQVIVKADDSDFDKKIK